MWNLKILYFNSYSFQHIYGIRIHIFELLPLYLKVHLYHLYGFGVATWKEKIILFGRNKIKSM